MSSVVVLPGRPPVWVENHARHIAERLSDRGRVLVVATHGPDEERMLPGEVGKGTVLGHARNGYPVWAGGRRAAFGLRRRGDVVVLVLWPGADGFLALAAALAARLRRERLVIDNELPAARHPDDRPGLIPRLVTRLAHDRVDLDAGAPEPVDERTVLAVCGADAGFAIRVRDAFAGMAAAAATGWRLRLLVDPAVTLPVDDAVRHRERITVEIGSPASAAGHDAAVVVVPDHRSLAGVASDAVARGTAAVVVGHPVSGRVVRRGDGVWLAADDPSAVLVAIEASTGAVHDAPVSPARLRLAGNAVVATVTALDGPADTPVAV